MSAEKRAASNSFGTSQLVKRQKSSTDLGGDRAVAVTNGAAGNGALIQAVSLPASDTLALTECVLNHKSKEGRLMQCFE